MSKNNKGKKSKKIKMVSAMLFFAAIVCLTYVFLEYGSEKIESDVRKIKDEAAVYAYHPQIKEEIAYERMVVCIDPGHGGEDPGALAGNTAEKDENLELAMRVKEQLEKYDIQVILTREDDSFVSLKKRAKIANKAEADLFVSLHRNYLESYDEVNGIDIYMNCAGTENDYKIGNALYEELTAVGGMKVNEPKPGSATDVNENYTVVSRTKMTACLIEMGYMSNKQDNRYFEDYRNRYSIAIAEAIVSYLQ